MSKRRASRPGTRTEQGRGQPSTWAAALTLVAALGVACSQDGSPDTRPSAPPPNVILIVLDTLRADRLGVYGREPSLTPRLDAFAQDATVFDHAYAHAPWTLPSVASLMTSETPDRHGAGSEKGRFTQLSPVVPTLAEVFDQAGYTTGAITNVLFLGPRFGAMRGFQSLDHVSPKDNRLLRIAEVTTDVALDWIDRHREDGAPFFLFVHYFDAHLNYDPPAPYRARYAAPEDRDGHAHVFGDVSEIVAFRRGQITIPSDVIDRLEKLYSGEVAYMDAEVGALFDGLDERGLLDGSIVALTADHGEEFEDHGGFEHGHTLYDELLQVPLVIHRPDPRAEPTEAAGSGDAPASLRGGHSDATVRLIDVAPTLVELAGLEVPDSFAGRSLVPQLEGAPGDDRAVVSIGNMWGPSGRAIRRGRFKLIESADGELVGLFDREADPGEKVDVASEHPDVVARLRAELTERLGPAARDHAPSPAAELDAHERAQLRALGYGD